MTDAQIDIYKNWYWKRKCGICEKKYPDKYLNCNKNTYTCRVDEIDVYADRS